MNILLTGGAGHIDSHTISELDKAGYSVDVVENLVNSNPESLKRDAKIFGKDIEFVNADVPGREAMDKVFPEHKIKDMCRDFWNRQKNNPRGYDGE